MAADLSAAEGLGTSQLRRFFLPGLIAAVGIHPHLPLGLLHELNSSYGMTSTIVFVAEVVLLGFLITSATVSIFQIYEGFSLAWLTRPARIWNEWRVSRLQTEVRKLYASSESDRVAELEVFLSDFPIQQEGDSYTYEVAQTTRLGNIIASYELYPERRYGIDGVFYWFHLVYLAPEVSREDYQENAVFAESVLLASAAGALVAVFAGSILVGHAAAALIPSLAIFDASASMSAAWASTVFGLAAFFLFYRLSWPAHRAVGRSFCALVDLSLPAFQDWVSKAPLPPSAALKKKAARLQRYLETLDLETDET